MSVWLFDSRKITRTHCTLQPKGPPSIKDAKAVGGGGKFKGHDKKIKRLCTIYGDTESTLEPVEEVVDDGSISKSYTRVKHKHRPCSFALVTASEFEDYVPETNCVYGSWQVLVINLNLI